MAYIGGLFIVIDVVDIPSQAKVCDLHHIALGDQHVSGSEVSVYTLMWTGRGMKKREIMTKNFILEAFKVQHFGVIDKAQEKFHTG